MRQLFLLFAFAVTACSSPGASNETDGTQSLPTGTPVENCVRIVEEDSYCAGPGMELIPDAWRCKPKVVAGEPGFTKRTIGGRACLLTAQDNAVSNLWCCRRLASTP